MIDAIVHVRTGPDLHRVPAAGRRGRDGAALAASGGRRRSWSPARHARGGARRCIARPGCLEKALRPDVLARAFKRRVDGSRTPTELLQRITVASGRKR